MKRILVTAVTVVLLLGTSPAGAAPKVTLPKECKSALVQGETLGLQMGLALVAVSDVLSVYAAPPPVLVTVADYMAHTQTKIDKTAAATSASRLGVQALADYRSTVKKCQAKTK